FDVIKTGRQRAAFNVPLSDMIRLGLLARQVDPANVRSCTLNGVGQSIGGASVVVLNGDDSASSSQVATDGSLPPHPHCVMWGSRVHTFDQFAQLKDLHEARPDFMQYGVTVARGTLTRLDRAFSAFYRRLAAGDKPGFPRFKARWRFDCASYEGTSGWKLKEGDRRLYLQGIGHVKLKLHRPLRGIPKTLHVRRQGSRWTATIQCADVPAQPLPPTGRQAGFDLGVVNL